MGDNDKSGYDNFLEKFKKDALLNIEKTKTAKSDENSKP